jgi:hypothetical protein
MDALWAWMGISPAYNIYAGLAECIAGFLLFFRRTTPLGALAAAAVLSNVVMMNFAYDVPVKILSTHLLLMSAFQLAPDLQRVIGVLALNRATCPADLGPYPTAPVWRLTRRIVKPVVIVITLAATFGLSWVLSKQYRERASRPPLYGIYEVKLFVRNRDTLPPLVTDTTR